MSTQPLIQCAHIHYEIPGTSIHFQDVSLSFYKKKYGIVGDNGTGKTTLLTLLAGRLKPHQGRVIASSQAMLSPQMLADEKSIAEILEIESVLDALMNIKKGSPSEEDFAIASNHWGLEADLASLLNKFNIHCNIKNKISTLSGGQKTKLLLIKAFLLKPNILLMDEPTNNLDLESKISFIQWLKDNDQCIIIASHDRTLLNEMDEIIELTPKGVSIYGGNYTFYQNQREQIQNRIQQKFSEAKSNMKHAQNSIQKTLEKHQQRAKKGRALRKSGSIDKLTANSKRGRSDKTAKRNNIQEIFMKAKAEKKLVESKQKLIIDTSITIDLKATRVPNNKSVLAIENLFFYYVSNKILFNNFNLHISGPERVALMGKNGSGKSTLVRLILQILDPIKGTIIKGIDTIAYLDQTISHLNPHLSLLENMLSYNSHFNTEEAYRLLAQFLFKGSDVTKKILELSGGEKIRAGLAIQLCAAKPPQLLILDEPTNHLDIKSISLLEKALKAYNGAMIVISHDLAFLNNINIQRFVDL